MSRKVAFITGASRGIGKTCAIELAAAGFDVAISARTLAEGEQREHSSSVKRSDTSALPGSLDGTAAEIEKHGARAFKVQADLLDPASLGAAVTKTLDTLGRIDVVVHNGRYIGPGHMDRFLETPIELLRKQIEGNAIAPLIINQLVLPSMIANGGGTLVSITSASGYMTPSQPAGKGGYGLGYGMSKAAFHRVAGFMALEHGDQGIRAYNVQPGFISTERMIQDMAKFGFDASAGAPTAVVAKVVRWLCTDPGAEAYSGQNIEAQNFCHEKNLLPGWPGPAPAGEGGNYDLSAWNLMRLNKGEKLYS
jgi:NAD(P)-dependent dehydrogenase (short-subunit alcohol dehydrogenase family)